MDNFTLTLPETLLSENLNRRMTTLKNSFEESFNHETVIFDFRNCKFLSPAGMVYIALWRDLLNERNIKTFYKKPNSNVLRILQSFGLVKKEKEESEVFDQYMIKMKRCMNISDCANVHNEIIKKVVDRKELNPETYSAIDYMLNELWDNSGVHGYECYESTHYPKPVYMGAFSHSDRIEICIADRGQGIYNSLKKNNIKYTYTTKKEVITEAVKYGVSGHPKGSPGFGLYCSSQFLIQGKGSLNIWSSGYQFNISNNSTKMNTSVFDAGTLISFIIYKSALIPFGKILSHPVHGARSAEEYIEEVIDGVFI